ncbi:MAG: tetratricopeptide repeat protein [Chitinispirillales bacterium]|jgi:tetratricopeptide (TPR) repeat protein|nr:tetratricopeptide repeat protein [Chitinispirillales bacterium]
MLQLIKERQDNPLLEEDIASARGHWNRGKNYSDQKDYDKAISEFTKAIQLRPNESSYRKYRGDAYHQKNDYDKAIADYAEAIRLDPKDCNSYDGRGRAYFKKKDYDEAIADFTEAIRLHLSATIQLHSNATHYNNRATSYYYKKDFKNAMTDSESVLRLDPNHSQAKKLLDWIRKNYTPPDTIKY